MHADRIATPSRARGSRWWLAALLLGVVFTLAIARFWHPVYGFTRFLQLDVTNEEMRVSAFNEQPVYVYHDTGGYDGLYYAQIAYDPSLRDPALLRAVDNLGYRARRILPPALAWALALGQSAWIVQVYAALNIAAWFALGWLSWRLLDVNQLSALVAWIGLMFSAGVLASVRLALTDLLALTALAGGMFALERSRSSTATGFLSAAVLCRETSLLAIVGWLTPPWLTRRNLVRSAIVVGPLIAWVAYVQWRVSTPNIGWQHFSPPLSGWLKKWSVDLAGILHPDPRYPWLSWTSLLANLGLMAQAAFLILRRQWSNPWCRIGTCYLSLAVFLEWAVWEGFPGAYTRVLLPLALAFNVLATRARAHLAWLVVGNLSVAAGLLNLADVHRDLTEISAAHTQRAKIVAHLGSGWSATERSSRHLWSWSDGHGGIDVRVWSDQPTRELTATCTLRSLTPRSVLVMQGGQKLAEADIGAERKVLTFPVHLENNRAHIELTSDQPAVAESANPGARQLAFALYDLEITPVR